MLDAPKNKHRAQVRPLDVQTLALTCGGLGFMRPAPGTWGSMPPAALAWGLLLAGASQTTFHIAIGATLAIACALCVWLGRYAETRFGRKDAAEVVIDETAGQCLPLLALPGAAFEMSSMGVHGFFRAAIGATAVCGAAFVLFRLADIVKPWPARSLERLPHGWGVLADDLMAGLYALLVVQILVRVFL